MGFDRQITGKPVSHQRNGFGKATGRLLITSCNRCKPSLHLRILRVIFPMTIIPSQYRQMFPLCTCQLTAACSYTAYSQPTGQPVRGRRATTGSTCCSCLPIKRRTGSAESKSARPAMLPISPGVRQCQPIHKWSMDRLPSTAASLHWAQPEFSPTWSLSGACLSNHLPFSGAMPRFGRSAGSECRQYFDDGSGRKRLDSQPGSCAYSESDELELCWAGRRTRGHSSQPERHEQRNGITHVQRDQRPALAVTLKRFRNRPIHTTDQYCAHWPASGKL